MPKDRWWFTADEIAAAVRQSLEAGDDAHAIRLMSDGINSLRGPISEGRLGEALAEPQSTGNDHWDLLFAAAIRYHLHRLGMKAPRWTYKQPLDKFWFPFAHDIQKSYNDMAHTPAEFRRLGIFIDEREFSQA